MYTSKALLFCHSVYSLDSAHFDSQKVASNREQEISSTKKKKINQPMRASSASHQQNLPSASTTTVTMTSASLAGQMWATGTTPAVQRGDGLLLRLDFASPRLAIASCAFSPADENCLVLGDVCGGVFSFHLGRNQFALVARFAGPVSALGWIDGAGHVAAVVGNAAYVVDVNTARSTSRPMQGPHRRPISRIAVPTDTIPRGVLTLVSGDALSVWRAQDMQCLKMISASSNTAGGNAASTTASSSVVSGASGRTGGAFAFADACMTDDAIYAIEGHHTLRCWTAAGFTHLETMTMREFHFIKIECSTRQLLAATDNGTIVVFHDRSLGSAMCAVHMMTSSPITSLMFNRPLLSAQAKSAAAFSNNNKNSNNKKDQAVPPEEEGESIFGCVQSDGVVSFASLPPPSKVTDTTAANLVLSFRAMPASSGGSVNSNFRLVCAFGNKELKLFHLPTSKAAYDKLSESSGKPPPLNTFVSFVSRRGANRDGSVKASWVSSAAASSSAVEPDVGRKSVYSAASSAAPTASASAAATTKNNNNNHSNDTNNNNTSSASGRTVRRAGSVAGTAGVPASTSVLPMTPPPKKLRASADDEKGGHADDDDNLQPTRENAIRDRLPAPNPDTLKNWLKVNLLSSAEATPLGQPVVVGDAAAKIVADRAMQNSSGGGPPSSARATAGGSNSPAVHVAYRPPSKFEDTSTVEGILGLRPLLDASSRQQNLDKLRSLLMRYGAYPEQYRGLIWRFLLCLPDKASMQPYYALLCSKGGHAATHHLLKPFPLPEGKLKAALTRALNCLAHHAAPFTVAHFVPATVFPFLHVFNSDVQSCVETILAFYLNWGREFFLYYPHMPVSIASFVSQTLQTEDKELYEHFASVGLGPEHFVWEPLMALYTEVLSTNEWLQVMDHAFSNAPIWLFLFHVRWLIQMRALLLRVDDAAAMLTYFHKATPFDLNVAIQQTYRLNSRYLRTDVTGPYERLETFPVDRSTESMVYPPRFDIHESVVFAKQEQLREISAHEQQLKIAQRRAQTAERQMKESAMLEEAFVRRQRALVEAKFDAQSAAWEQKVLLERERLRLRDVEHEARLHAVQEQLRSAARIEALQQELGAAADTEGHSAMDRAMESEKWNIAERMSALEIDRMEKAAKMKLAAMIHVAGGGAAEAGSRAAAAEGKFPPDNMAAPGQGRNPLPQRMVAKVIPKAQQQQQQGRRPAAGAGAPSSFNHQQQQGDATADIIVADFQTKQKQQQQQQQAVRPSTKTAPPQRPDAALVDEDGNEDPNQAPDAFTATAAGPQQHQQQQQQRRSVTTAAAAAAASTNAVDALEDHHKNVRSAYERIQASQRAARAALRSDFSKAAVAAVPLMSGEDEGSDASSAQQINNRRASAGAAAARRQHHSRRELVGDDTTSSEGAGGAGGAGGGRRAGGGRVCPTGCCSTSSCSCVGTELSNADPPAPLLPAHRRPLPTLHVSLAGADDDD